MSRSPKRILIIGVGSIGERHLRCLQATEQAAVGLCEPVLPLRERIASQYNVELAFDSLDVALEQPWDSAVVATPANTHIPIAMRLVEAGIAPLIEKPLAVAEAGVAELVEALDRTQLVAGVAYVYRAHPALQAMRDALLAGKFGKPLQVTVIAGQHFPTYRPTFADTYYNDRARGGGATQDALTHLVNSAEWLVGPITRLTADMAHLKLPDVTVEDTVHVLARHGQVLGSYSLNQHQAPNEMTMTVICENGTARWELHRHAWRWMATPDSPWEEQVIDFKSRDDWFTAQERAWLDVLAGEAEPLCTVREAWQTLRATRAMLSAAERDDAWQTLTTEETLA
ncbi:Gfo/Idh/MocA family protein [Phycisphaerales bacterium AB-hyl4]|uniref:Gfo/Idh/MocA family protein n=1 Tax=Natronomicrosphaera hydrolytica TaxID=3242702 RepID=A0ABV4U706_9BACT